MSVAHRFTKECGGYTVVTLVDGRERMQAWTAGHLPDARKLADDHEAMLFGRDIHGCCAASARCAYHTIERIA